MLLLSSIPLVKDWWPIVHQATKSKLDQQPTSKDLTFEGVQTLASISFPYPNMRIQGTTYNVYTIELQKNKQTYIVYA